MAHLRDRVISRTSQASQETLRPPVSGKLKVDRELKLSNDNFKQSVETFYANKQLSAIDQLKATPPYPSPHVLAQFANKAYADNQHADPEPPAGWQLLTTASNNGKENGYFGTAYWHPEHQQVVIAHRGTDINNVSEFLNDFYTDLEGVLSNNYVPQMNSASTFVNKVVAVLQEIEQEQNVSFELFFTGHSLGGWLAQITTFTTEYLEEKRGTFLKKPKTEQEKPLANSTVQDSPDIQKDGPAQINPLNFQYIKDNFDVFLKNGETKQGEQQASNTLQDSHDVKHSYHPHTVVFDSPGCEEMLLKMKRTYDVRNKGRSIDLQQLDITSYLSAPNLINTCNFHLGTVYRIFTNLSDMDWKKKNTPLYNLATHSMDKIVQAFDTETGQVRKDDEGESKIREVVDWPIRAGLIYGTELKDFFKWAEHINNYHPEVTDRSHTKVPGYHEIRYQTKAYDECTKSLSVFTEEEREFLERYRWLRDIKPEGLFGVMKNAEVENRTEQNLQKYDLDNESVRCPDASNLQMLIPYVRRLIRLSPHVKENIKDKLSPTQIINNVYQYETKRNVAKIKQSALDFKPGALGLREFLTSDKQIWHLRMVDGDSWTGISRVYRALQKTTCEPKYSSEGHYTILKLKRLLIVSGMINLNALLSSKRTSHLLMIACGTNQPVNDELKNMFQELFSILKQNKTVKIILITQSDDNTGDSISEIAKDNFGEGFTKTDEQLTWSDLTRSSKRKMLEKTVIFQGREVALGQLISAKSITYSFALAALLQEKEFRIGEEPVSSARSGYNEKYYIDRTFNHNIVIRQDILNDEKARKFADLLASTEQKFKELCEQNPTSNVHWLESDNSGELIWQQSQGNLQALRKYIDKQKSHSYAPSDLGKLLEQAKHQRVMIIADKAGMGKTTVLTYLSKRIKQKYPAHWFVRIDLNDYTEILNAQKGNNIHKMWVLEFVSKKVLKLESDLEKEFIKSFERKGVKKVVVMVDGFDEISPQYKETVIDMLQVLRQTSLEQLWVTTRPHLKEELEDKLEQLSFTLQPFSEEEQVEFLQKFWLQNSNTEDTKPRRLEIYAKALIQKLAKSISDKDREFTGIPLQTRMLAEAFEEERNSFYLSENSQPELPQKLELLELYRKFMKSKFEIYYQEKPKIPAGNVSAEEQRERDVKYIELDHQLLAFQALFTENQVRFLQHSDQSKLLGEALARFGIAQRNQEGKPQFIHRTFAEYFVAEFLINHLSNENKQNTHVQEFLLNEALLETECHIIRAFLNGQWEKSEPTVEILKEVGKKLDEQWKEREKRGTLKGVTTALHEAAKEDNVHIIGFLLNSLKSGET